MLLPIEIKAREFDAKILQSAVAAERGFDVVLGEQNAMIRQMRSLPRGVYIDKSVARTKTQPFQRLRAAGNSVAAWCEEGLVYIDRDTYLHERVSEASLALADMFFAWGPVQANDVGSHVSAAKDKILVTGNPRFDVLRPELRGLFDRERDALRQRFGRYILVATNFGRYNHFMGYDFHLAALKKRGTITTPEQIAFYRRWREYLGELYRGFALALPVLARAFPDHHIVVRPHPSEDHEAWRRETHGLDAVTVAFDGSAIPWIAGADALIHNSCTTGVEAYLLGKPVIAFRPATDDTYDSYLPKRPQPPGLRRRRTGRGVGCGYRGGDALVRRGQGGQIHRRPTGPVGGGARGRRCCPYGTDPGIGNAGGVHAAAPDRRKHRRHVRAPRAPVAGGPQGPGLRAPKVPGHLLERSADRVGAFGGGERPLEERPRRTHGRAGLLSRNRVGRGMTDATLRGGFAARAGAVGQTASIGIPGSGGGMERRLRSVVVSARSRQRRAVAGPQRRPALSPVPRPSISAGVSPSNWMSARARTACAPI